MTAFSKRICLLLLMLSTLVNYGCGGGGGAGTASTPVDTTSVQKGSVLQGPVAGATVFADNVAAGTRFVQDPGEISAQSDSAGNFFLPSFPGYDFILVSTGGVDTITSQQALLLLAPAGSANITPLTTLVTLDTTQALRAKLESLMGGARFDSNVSTNATPAALMLVKSVETAVQLVRDTVRQAATDAGVTLTQTQINYIQAQTWQKIALEFASTSQNLSTPAGLCAALTNALTSAADFIKSQNLNIAGSSFASTTMISIANVSVNTALNALGAGVDRTSAVPLGTTTIRTESSITSSVFAAAVSSTVNALKALSSVVVIGVTPNPYSPAPIPVVTITNAAIIRIITGASGGTGGTGVTF